MVPWFGSRLNLEESLHTMSFLARSSSGRSHQHRIPRLQSLQAATMRHDKEKQEMLFLAYLSEPAVHEPHSKSWIGSSWVARLQVETKAAVFWIKATQVLMQPSKQRVLSCQKPSHPVHVSQLQNKPSGSSGSIKDSVPVLHNMRALSL